MENIIKKIFDYSLEDIMGDRFSKYSKSIIQDRALPDVRDGLKPVQRRILYSMYREKHTFDKPYVKSARCVGDIMGKYHPHGDSSIYEAIVRMSQWWKQNTTLIDMQGNNGSMDGDGAAAMRYTESRLSKISLELINKDIDKDTVLMSPNFDDKFLEPTVLPAKFPNLLVNGSTGISAGYATNIPPHNLGEIIDATIKRIDSPNCYLETVLDIVKGPDFPTGGVIYGKNGIIDAFKTGRGKIILRSKYEVVKNKGKEQIIISNIPFDVNKQAFVTKINEIRIDKKVEGILDARDESDREDSVRVVIDLKKDANKDLIISYLLKNTDMQISYNYNMVAIKNKRPQTLGILEILDAYISHQKEVITKRTSFDLKHAKERMHIVEGLMKALSILDEVIRTIRASLNKSDAKNNLVKEYGFTELQAEAIVILQLYRLTNTDITELINEKNNLEIIINGLLKILEDENTLKTLMKDELRSIKKKYGEDRKSAIVDEIEEIKIDTTKLIPKEDVVVALTKEGYIKRCSKRSYNSEEETILKEKDYLISLYDVNTLDTILIFTDKGNYLYLPVHEIPDLKWKELGKHISNIIPLDPGENIIYSTLLSTNKDITIFTKNGMVKRTNIDDFKVVRYSKPITAIKLKDKDKVISVTDSLSKNVLITTKRGYILRYLKEEIPVTGLKAAGVKAINLKDDEVVSGLLFNDLNDYVSVITTKSTGKRVKLSDIEITSRARKGILIIRDVKTNPYFIISTLVLNKSDLISFRLEDDFKDIKNTELSISDRYSTGSSICKDVIKEVFIKPSISKVEELEIKNDVEPLAIIDEKIYTIEDYLEDFKLD